MIVNDVCQTKQGFNRMNAVSKTCFRNSALPAVDIYETKDDFKLIADMPGANEDSIEVSIEKNVLAIKGKVESLHTEGYKLIHSESNVEDYGCIFTLGDEIDRDQIKAGIKHGVLTVCLPKIEPVKARKIEVKAD